MAAHDRQVTAEAEGCRQAAASSKQSAFRARRCSILLVAGAHSHHIESTVQRVAMVFPRKKPDRAPSTPRRELAWTSRPRRYDEIYMTSRDLRHPNSTP